MTRRERAATLLSPGTMRLDRRIAPIVAIYLVIVSVIVGYDARLISDQRGSAISINVAGRQRGLAERYEKDVILATHGVQADPGADEEQLLTNADALLHGGDVTAVKGAEDVVHIRPAGTDPLIVNKVAEAQRLIGELVAAGNALSNLRPGEPGYAARLQDLRVAGAQVTSVSDDLVGELTADAEASFRRLVAIAIALGIVGALAAVAMGLLIRRAAARNVSQFRTLVHHASDLITVVEPGGTIMYQSPSVQRLIGSGQDDLAGTDYFDLLVEDDVPHVRAIFTDVSAAPDATVTAEYRMRHTDGSSRYVESIVSNLVDDPTVNGLVLNTRDVTDRKILQEELAHQAFHDSLTGLSNRAVFHDRIGHALARSERHDTRLAVFLLDLDGFKTVNDSLGHDAGDQLLIAVAKRLEFQGRSSDTVARIGGDEFGILLEDDADEARARSLADRALAAFAVPFEVQGREVFIRASIGIVLSVPGDSDTDELIRNADTAMYAAKAAGKGRYEFFRPFMHTRALERFEVQADLERAIVRGEFVVHYQPIVDFETRVVRGVEALVRWNHPSRGMLAPIEFIPVAEETGAIVPLGAWVLGEACRQTAAWRAAHVGSRDLSVSVNLSTRQLLEADLVTQVRDVLDATGLEPAALTLELTEGSLMQDVEETIVQLGALKELGVRLAIDDFGTGSSSLGYLQRFPIDTLKIDKSFVDGIATDDSEDPALVRAIVQMASTLSLETIAEGIEGSDQLDELRSAGCRAGQGYLFARPLVADALEAFLDTADAAGSVDARSV
jgi:diguanylate cyclase (GGDEF)-like protein/PAS domain S-box-containing protein